MRQGEGEEALRIGISACLLGEEVRFDGGHKKDRFLVDNFGKYVEWVPVCPEIELGLGSPRESMRLVREGGLIRLRMPRSGRDLSDEMREYSRRRARELAALDLVGFVLKKSSPSCGMERVKVYDPNGVPSSDGRGLFAEALLDRCPLLPVEEEGRLYDPVLRDSFIERVFAYQRLNRLFAGRWTVGQLVAFHTAHKLQLMAHSPSLYQQLGRLVAGAARLPRADLKERYQDGFMRALGARATRGRNGNVLQHMLGYFRDRLDEPGRADLLARIEDYRRGLVPLIVPVTLLRHHVTRLDVAYLAGQSYLEPHPRELMLRNHV